MKPKQSKKQDKPLEKEEEIEVVVEDNDDSKLTPEALAANRKCLNLGLGQMTDLLYE